jgi:hypothetical protein
MPNLITRTDIVNITGLNSLVEDRKMAPWITEVHIRWRKILGRALYDLQQATPSATRFVDLMADEKGWGKSYLCWKALELSYPSLSAEADRGGVFVKEGDGMRAVDPRTLQMLISRAESAAEERERMLMQYLKDNEALFPELETITGSESRIDATKASNTGGISFRKSDKQRSYRG